MDAGGDEGGWIMPDYQPLYARSYALVMGIDGYQYLPPLGAAARGARELAGYLGNLLQFETTLLVDEQVTRDAVFRWLSATRRAAGPDDRVVVYFAGHGMTRGDASYERGYFALADSVPDEWHTALPMDDVIDEARYIKAKHLLYLLDCCFGGLALDGRAAPDIPRELEYYITRPVRYAISAGGREVVDDSMAPGGEYSLFTYHLLDWLKGQEGVPASGIWRARELGNHLEAAVGRDRRSGHKPNHNYLPGSGDGDFVFHWEMGTRFPADMQMALISPSAYLRQGAVVQLIELAQGDDPALAALAHEKLQTMASGDPAPQVRQAAQSYFDEREALAQQQVDEQRRAEAAAQMEAARRRREEAEQALREADENRLRAEEEQRLLDEARRLREEALARAQRDRQLGAVPARARPPAEETRVGLHHPAVDAQPERSEPSVVPQQPARRARVSVPMVVVSTLVVLGVGILAIWAISGLSSLIGGKGATPTQPPLQGITGTSALSGAAGAAGAAADPGTMAAQTAAAQSTQTAQASQDADATRSAALDVIENQLSTALATPNTSNFLPAAASIRQLQPLARPSGSSMTHDMQYITEDCFHGVAAQQFMAEATFSNPYPSNQHRWDIGFKFLGPVNGYLYLGVKSTGEWFVEKFEHTDFSGYLASGTTAPPKGGAADSNKLTLIATDRAGMFAVNDQFVSKFSLENVQQSGKICPVTGLFVGDSLQGASTVYGEFTIWSLAK